MASAPELSVLVPCLNEEHNVPELVRRVLATFDKGGFAGEVILVDDGSTDGTARVVREAEAAHGERVRGVFHPENRGIHAAWRSAALAARGARVCTIDADLQYQPEDILRLRRELLESGVDVVQGARSAVGRLKDHRYHLSRGLNLLLNATFGMDLADNKSGFVLCAREVFLDLLRHERRYAYWQSFILVAAHAKGYSYREVETLFQLRRQGTSFLEGKGALVASARSIVDLGKAAVEYRLAAPPKGTLEGFLARHPAPDRSPPRSGAELARLRAYSAAFPASHWMIGRDAIARYELLRRSQWLSPEETRALQEERLRRAVRHAYHHVPFYRDKLREAGVGPEDVRTLDDLRRLPLVSKDEVRRHLFFDMLSDDHDKSQVLQVQTSGSTGEPFVCFADRAQLELRWAATLRAQEWTGYRFGDPTVRLWHQTLGMSRAQALRERLDARLSNRTFVPVFELREDSLEATVRHLEERRPALLDGYAEALDLLAGWLLDRGRVVPVGAVMSSAQTLGPASRARIEQAFACRVFDKYGAREFSGVAYECEAHAGHHVVAEAYVVEVLREGRPAAPGEIGEVVVTDLENRCMPFLRYRIGDLAVAMGDAPCSCGRGAPRVGDIEGRVQSIIRGASGRYLPGTFFAHCLKEYEHAIRRFQVLQEEPGAIRFRFVPGGRFSDATLAEVLATFRRYLGEDTRIDVERVERIELVRTGKHLAALSSLPLDLQERAPAFEPVVGLGRAP